MTIKKTLSLALAGLLPMPLAVSAAAQTPRDAKLNVSVVDPRGDILPNAVVTLVPQEEAGKAQTLKPATASAKGVAAFESLMPGLYTIQATFPGLEPGK